MGFVMIMDNTSNNKMPATKSDRLNKQSANPKRPDKLQVMASYQTVL
jgi:hypothetical protein